MANYPAIRFRVNVFNFLKIFQLNKRNEGKLGKKMFFVICQIQFTVLQPIF